MKTYPGHMEINNLQPVMTKREAGKKDEMGHTVGDNPSPFVFFQQLSPRVNPNLTRTKASVYEARMLTALIHLCFAQFWRDYTMGAFVTDTRVGEWQGRNTNKHCKIPLPASNFDTGGLFGC